MKTNEIEPALDFTGLAYRVANARVRQRPFPHIYIPSVLNAPAYDAIVNSLPMVNEYVPLVDTGRVGRGYSPNRFVIEHPEQHRNAIGRFAFYLLYGGDFRAALQRVFPMLRLDAFRQECLLMRDGPGYSLGPHTDSPSKLLSVLFYLPRDYAGRERGTSFYVPKDPAFRCPGGPHYPRDRFTRVWEAPYQPNAMLAFLKTDNSFHGVEPVGDHWRDLLLYDLRVPS